MGVNTLFLYVRAAHRGAFSHTIHCFTTGHFSLVPPPPGVSYHIIIDCLLSRYFIDGFRKT